MRRRVQQAVVTIPLVLVAVLAGGCTTGPASSGSPAQLPQDTPAATPAAPTQAPVSGEVPAEMVEAARAELATVVGADAAAGATVITARAVDWPDSSLGCPQPGMMYMQVITPGYQVVFEIDGKQYDMRASAAGSLLLCEPGQVSPG